MGIEFKCLNGWLQHFKEQWNHNMVSHKQGSGENVDLAEVAQKI
jgi:hypothetical protein